MLSLAGRVTVVGELWGRRRVIPGLSSSPNPNTVQCSTLWSLICVRRLWLTTTNQGHNWFGDEWPSLGLTEEEFLIEYSKTLDKLADTHERYKNHQNLHVLHGFAKNSVLTCDDPSKAWIQCCSLHSNNGRWRRNQRLLHVWQASPIGLAQFFRRLSTKNVFFRREAKVPVELIRELNANFMRNISMTWQKCTSLLSVWDRENEEEKPSLEYIFPF